MGLIKMQIKKAGRGRIFYHFILFLSIITSSPTTGQFISVKQFIPELGYEQPRQYSLSAAPNGKYLRVSVKREVAQKEKPAGKMSNLLHADVKVFKMLRKKKGKEEKVNNKVRNKINNRNKRIITK
jgi:hypothetical protein